MTMKISVKKKRGITIASNQSLDQAEQGDNLMPIMSLMIILIPLLIGNMAFFKLRALDILIPGEVEEQEQKEKDKSEQKVVVHLKIYDGRLIFDLVNSEDGSNIKRFTYEEGINKIDDLQYKIENLRDEYAKLDTCLVEVDVGLGFDWITHVLAAIKDAFQVKIGESYEKQLKLVLLTNDEELTPFEFYVSDGAPESEAESGVLAPIPTEGN